MDDNKLNDTPEKLLNAFNELIETQLVFAIVTCRSGIAVDIYKDDASYINNSGKRLAYTVNNNNSLSKTIKEALKKYNNGVESDR